MELSKKKSQLNALENDGMCVVQGSLRVVVNRESTFTWHDLYKLTKKIENGVVVYKCSCQDWMGQKASLIKTCKHLCQVRGYDEEATRIYLDAMPDDDEEVNAVVKATMPGPTKTIKKKPKAAKMVDFYGLDKPTNEIAKGKARVFHGVFESKVNK